MTTFWIFDKQTYINLVSETVKKFHKNEIFTDIIIQTR